MSCSTNGFSAAQEEYDLLVPIYWSSRKKREYWYRSTLAITTDSNWPPGHFSWLTKKSGRSANEAPTIQQLENDVMLRQKVAIVGPSACGETCAAIVFTKGTFPEIYVPTIFETYTADIEIETRHLKMAV